MLLTKDIAAEKPESMLDLVQMRNWFGCRVGELNINQAGLLLELEREAAWPKLVSRIGTPSVQSQYLGSLYTLGLEAKEERETGLYIYGLKTYESSFSKVGYPLGLSYSVGEELKIGDTGAVSIVWLEGGIFSIGCSVSVVNDEIQLPKSLERRLEKISRLPEKWDSYSASRISGKAIEKTKSLLIEAGIHCGISVLEEAFIAPCSDGGIQLEWTSESDNELILKILPSGEQDKYYLVESSREGDITEKEGIIRRPEDWKPLLDKLCHSKKSR